jgi:hypothetical protein
VLKWRENEPVDKWRERVLVVGWRERALIPFAAHKARHGRRGQRTLRSVPVLGSVWVAFYVSASAQERD